MNKYIIREVFEPDFELYFDCDCYSAAAGDYCYTVFPIIHDRHDMYSAINGEEYKTLDRDMNYFYSELYDLVNGYSNYNNTKEILTDYNIPYSPYNAHKAKELEKSIDYIEQLIGFLELRTGEKWDVIGCCGYCQGDYVHVVYCEKYYNEKSAHIIGDLVLGCGKEFSITELDDNGEELDTVYGYFVADCEAWKDEEYKNLVCSYEGINPDEATLELIETYTTVTTPVYRTA